MSTSNYSKEAQPDSILQANTPAQPAKNQSVANLFQSLKISSILKKSKYLDWRTSNVKGIKSRVTVNCSLPLALISKLLDSTEAIKSTNRLTIECSPVYSINQSINPIQSLSTKKIICGVSKRVHKNKQLSSSAVASNLNKCFWKSNFQSKNDHV